ncbi:uncharacterized protein LOC125682303 isoform X2 [Ostrea edulis]|uniref:uncharacterized protein LOC125682303 isoform X2 n=1 Tax=Ostrea edulis TaxID=37623 RepID=UPI0024AE927E|nr:uncharacterized protein LOC125682303 isoform X2 [Ostrea edulis]
MTVLCFSRIGGLLLVCTLLLVGCSTDTEVTRHVKIHNIKYNVPDTPSTALTQFPSSFNVRFHLNHVTQKLNLTRNIEIHSGIEGCDHQTGKCHSSKEQMVSFYQDLSTGASFQITCSEISCQRFTLLGTFISENSMYSMEPVKRSNKYKIKKLPRAHQLKTDYYKPDDIDFVPTRGRHKRATGRYNVELLVVTDSSVYKYWQNFLGSTASESEVENYLKTFTAFTVNGMDVRYRSINAASYEIRIVYVGVYIAKNSSQSPWSSNYVQSDRRLDADQALNAFSNWVDTNKNILPKHDHAMAFTEHNLIKGLGTLNNDIAGYAFQGLICKSRSQSIVEENFNFISHTVAAHELGHSLGAKHDGTENSCNLRDYYIMEAVSTAVSGGKTTHPWLFSTCSVQEINALLTSIDSSNNCLKRIDYTGTGGSLASYISRQIGQQFSVHDQCVYAMKSPNSYACLNNFNGDFSSICTGLWCFNPDTGNSCDLVVPLDYTTCGSRKWCHDGICESDAAAPNNPETCLFGNFFTSNCSGISSNPSLCYVGYAVGCCQSCKDVSSGVAGCEYGDRQDVCSSITSGAPCYSSNTDVQCCATCAKFRTQIPSCEYGDLRNCSALTYPGDCYGSLSDGSAARTSCCQTCNNYETGNQDCMYGDRVLDCRVSECATYATAGILKDCCETCKSYIVSTPAPNSNSTALPSWVIPAAAGAGGGLLVIIIIVVACCCCRKSPSEEAALKYQPQMKSSVPRQPNPRYKSEIRQPNGTEYMGPISAGDNTHMYERPLPSRPVQQQMSGPSRQMSTKSNVYMELEPDPNFPVSVSSGYVVSSNQQYTNAGYSK